MKTFFIIGAQKSGTTWLQRLLNDLPGIACFGESHFVDRLLVPLSGVVNDYNQMMGLVADRVYEGAGFYGNISNQELLTVGRSWLLEIFKRTAGPNRWAGLQIVGDKTPAHSFHIPTLRIMFPEAKFIHMLRDGRDVVVSAYHHRSRILRKLGQDDSLRSLIEEAPGLFLKWKQFTQAVLERAPGLSMHTVRYEDLLTNPHSELQATAQYLLPDLDWSNSSIETSINRNSFARQSGGRSTGTVSDQSFLRQGVSGGWRREFSQADVHAWDSEGLALLQKLGYSL